MHPHFNISGLRNGRGVFLELTQGSVVGRVKFYNFKNQEYFLEQDVEFRYPFTGASSEVAFISDLHMVINFISPMVVKAANSVCMFTKAVRDLNSRGNLSKIFVLGDICHYHQQPALDSYFSIRSQSVVPSSDWHEITGDHDRFIFNGCPNELKTLLTQGVTLGNICFIVCNHIDSSFYEDGLLRSLLTCNQDKNIVILSHKGREGTIAGTEVGRGVKPVDAIEQSLEGLDWDAWFCGHTHGHRSAYGTETEFYSMC